MKEFIDIDFEKNEEEKAIKFMEKYGGQFIDINNPEDIIFAFIEEQLFLKNILKLIKKYKKFPYEKITPSKINEFISINEEIVIPQREFIQRINRFKNKKPFAIPDHAKNIYDYYDYPIHLIYNYLDQKINNKTYSWRECLYCGEWFYATQKNITCCCPQHSTKMRKKRNNDKNK